MGRTATDEDTNDFSFPLTLGADTGKHQDLIGDEEDDEEELDPTVAALQDSFQQLAEKSEKDQEFFQSQLNNMLSQLTKPQQQQQQQQLEDPTNVNLDDLPDPVENKAEFNKELSKRMSAALKATQDQTAAAVSAHTNEQQNIAGLESTFKTNHPELAKKGALFAATLQQEVNKLKNKGVNAKDFVFADPDKFLKTVASAMQEELGLEDEDLDEDLIDDEQDETPRRKRKVSAKKRTSRTRGVSSRSAPVRKAGKRKAAKTMGFVDQLKKQQQEMGIV